MKVTLTRSKQWVLAERVNSGTNVPDTVVVDVDPASLTVDSRRAVLEAAGGKYPDEIGCLAYNQEFEVRAGTYGYGVARFDCDTHNPTPEDAANAIESALCKIEADRKEHQRLEAERNAERQRKAEEKAERDRKLAEARELLADDLCKSEQRLAERDLLAEFLATVPVDALRGAVKRFAAQQTATSTEDLIKKI